LKLVNWDLLTKAAGPKWIKSLSKSSSFEHIIQRCIIIWIWLPLDSYATKFI